MEIEQVRGSMTPPRGTVKTSCQDSTSPAEERQFAVRSGAEEVLVTNRGRRRPYYLPGIISQTGQRTPLELGHPDGIITRSCGLAASVRMAPDRGHVTPHRSRLVAPRRARSVEAMIGVSCSWETESFAPPSELGGGGCSWGGAEVVQNRRPTELARWRRWAISRDDGPGGLCIHAGVVACPQTFGVAHEPSHAPEPRSGLGKWMH